MTLLAAYLIAAGTVSGAVSLAAILGYVLGRTRALDAVDRPAPAPHPVEVRSRRGEHIRWRHQLDRDLAAATETALEAGLLRDLQQPAWATNHTQPYPHTHREGR